MTWPTRPLPAVAADGPCPTTSPASCGTPVAPTSSAGPAPSSGATSPAPATCASPGPASSGPNYRDMTDEALAGSLTLLDQKRALALEQLEYAEARYQDARAEQIRREREARSAA